MSAHLNRDAVERVLRFANSRWGHPNDMKSEITKAAKTRSLAIALDVYLDTLARKHDMQARALRLAARAARGEDMNTLLNASLSERREDVSWFTEVVLWLIWCACEELETEMPTRCHNWGGRMDFMSRKARRQIQAVLRRTT